MKITILQKPGQFTAKDFNLNIESAVRTLKGDLSSSVKLDGFSKSGWARINITGDDSEVVSELVARKLSQAQTELAKIESQGVYEGIVTGETKDCVEVDIGIDTPRPLNVKIRVETLRAQLADGKPIGSNGIIRDYCLFPGSKASVRITRLERASGVIEGWFADSHIERLSSWMTGNLYRIQIFDCYEQEVESAVKKSNIERDIVSIEPATLTAQSVVCKLGTDAVGLIPKLGSVLRKRELQPFIPKRILTRCRPW
jgi:hypothetical protein